MTWIYLSPHFDDVALSCGGLVWEQARAGQLVGIWTICAGDPPSIDLSPFAQELHRRWEAQQDAPVNRKAEDMNACQRLGASFRHFLTPDCIYRRHPQTGEFMYVAEAALNGPLEPGDAQTALEVSQELGQSLPAEATLVCPLALGAHVDHQLTRLATERLGRKLWYYADFPYVLRSQTPLEEMVGKGWECQVFAISNDGLSAWQDSISAHRSQISTFWSSDEAMRQAIRAYRDEYGGIRLWRATSPSE